MISDVVVIVSLTMTVMEETVELTTVETTVVGTNEVVVIVT